MTASTNSAKSIRFGLLITAIGGFLFSFDLPLLRLADNDKWTLVFTRGLFLFFSITLAWWIVRFKTGSKAPFIAGSAGLAVIATSTLANISFIGALKGTDTANVVFILALVPVLTAVFSRIFIGEEIHSYTWVATLISLLGVGIIVADSLKVGQLWGDFLALVCAVCTATAFTIIRASRKNVATSLALGSLISALIAISFFNVDIQNLIKPAAFGMPSWFWVAMNGLIVIPLSTALIANGSRFLPSADVSMFFLLETILAPIWIWMLFKEIPSHTVLIGSFLVISTLVAHSLWRLMTTLSPQAT